MTDRSCYDCAHVRVCKYHEAGEKARPPHSSDVQIRPYLVMVASARALACDAFEHIRKGESEQGIAGAAKGALALLDEGHQGDAFEVSLYDEQVVNQAHRLLASSLRGAS